MGQLRSSRAEHDAVMERYGEFPATHRAHLAIPPDDEVEARFNRLLLEPGLRMDVPPIHVCGVDQTVVFEPERAKIPDGLLPEETTVQAYVHYLSARNLNDLKEWIGIPNRSFARVRSELDPDPLRGVNIADLPVTEQIEYERLSYREKVAVADLRIGLLRGEVDGELIENPPFKAVAEDMVRRSAALPAFVGNTLYVCDGDTVKFTGFAVLKFDQVIVEGEGRLFLGPGTKLHAYQIAHK